MMDISHTESGDIDFSKGDLTYSESTVQHQKDILVAAKGHYKGTPELGVDVLGYVNDTEPENLYRAIRKEFTRDGMKVTKVSMDNTIAQYEESNG